MGGQISAQVMPDRGDAGGEGDALGHQGRRQRGRGEVASGKHQVRTDGQRDQRQPPGADVRQRSHGQDPIVGPDATGTWGELGQQVEQRRPMADRIGLGRARGTSGVHDVGSVALAERWVG